MRANKFKTLVVTACLGLSVNALAGVEGHGGGVLVCFNKVESALKAQAEKKVSDEILKDLLVGTQNGLKAVTTYDLYLARLPRGMERRSIPIYEPKEGESQIEFTMRILSRLYWVPDLKSNYESAAQKVSDLMYIEEEGPIDLVEGEAAETPIPRNCVLANIAHRVDERNYIVVDTRLLNHPSYTLLDRYALTLHEVLQRGSSGLRRADDREHLYVEINSITRKLFLALINKTSTAEDILNSGVGRTRLTLFGRQIMELTSGDNLYKKEVERLILETHNMALKETFSKVKGILSFRDEVLAKIDASMGKLVDRSEFTRSAFGNQDDALCLRGERDPGIIKSCQNILEWIAGSYANGCPRELKHVLKHSNLNNHWACQEISEWASEMLKRIPVIPEPTRSSSYLYWEIYSIEFSAAFRAWFSKWVTVYKPLLDRSYVTENDIKTLEVSLKKFVETKGSELTELLRTKFFRELGPSDADQLKAVIRRLQSHGPNLPDFNFISDLEFVPKPRE